MKQMRNVLNFLEKNGSHYLISGPKSIAVVESGERERNNLSLHKKSYSKFSEDSTRDIRRSLVFEGRKQL